MSVQTDASIYVGEGVSVDTTKTSVSITIDNSISTEASVKIGNDNANVEAGVSAKTGTLILKELA